MMLCLPSTDAVLNGKAQRLLWHPTLLFQTESTAPLFEDVPNFR